LRKTIAFLGCALSLPWSVGAATGPATAPQPLVAAARVAKAEYCFAVSRSLRVERNPPPPLVLRVQLDVTYRNMAARPVILPWQYERTPYTSLMPGVMKAARENLGLFTPSLAMMMRLPANVNPANPADPQNDEFRVIPPGGVATLPIIDLVTVTIHKDGRQKVDIRGKTLYLRMKFSHRQLAPDLEAQLSDKWTRFGVPWTGDILTNTMMINVPASLAAADCVDTRNPNEGKDVDRSLKLQR